jgi:predicted glycoside hydrolase/deacetylase ChbG (UPF0249 family)
MPQKIFAADDWGFSPAINEGILRLAEKGWLRSVSCAANSAFLMHGLESLRGFVHSSGVRVALHFNLTYGPALKTADPSLIDPATGRFHSHRRLMLRTMCGQIEAASVVEEFEAQLRHLRETDLPVDQMDGHHHVHLLPCIASALQPLLKKAGIRRLRVLRDRQHLFSFAQTEFFRRFIDRKHAELEMCDYLRPRHLRSRESLLRKLEASAPRALLVHPALYDDFAESGMTDAMRGYRVHELKTVMKILDE